MPRTPSNLEKVLKLDYQDGQNNIWLTSQHSLRKLIGILGICLPLFLFIVVYADSGFNRPLYSISHYYFTRASAIFVVIVSLLAVFLLIYKGAEPIDFYISSIAGLFALLLVLFPTNSIAEKFPDADRLWSVTVLRESKIRVAFHYLSAAIFLGCLSYMSIFLFTRSDKSKENRGRAKRRRNRVFRICGVIMLVAILVILANFLGLISDDAFERYALTFWMECVAVWAFGISWLVKAEVILRDERPVAGGQFNP